MNNKLIEEVIQQLPPEETYIGTFYGMARPSLWLIFLMGPLMNLLSKSYYVSITENKLYFTKLNLMNKILNIDSFEDIEISSLIITKNMFSSYTCKFVFSNGNKLKMIAHFNEKKKDSGFLTDEIFKVLQARFKCF